MNQINCIAAHESGFYGQGVRVIIYRYNCWDNLDTVFDSLNLLYTKTFYK